MWKSLSLKELLTMEAVKLCVFFFLLGYAYCAHSPSGGMLIPDIVDLLWINADVNDDSQLSLTEFFREFIDNFNHDTDQTVSETEFIHQWSHNYHESKSVTLHVFQHFDLDGDGIITQADLNRLFNHMDYNADQYISKAEFATLMAYVFGRLPYN